MGIFSFFKKGKKEGNWDDLTDQTQDKIQKIETLIKEGDSLVKSGKLQQGLKVFQNILSIEPFQPYALNNTGWILIQFGKFNDALPLIQKAISIDEQCKQDHTAFWQFYSNLANCHMRLEKFDLALEAFLKAIPKAPKNALSGLYFDAARCLYFLDKGDDAINCVLKSLSFNLKDGDGFELLGQIYLYLKKFPLFGFACFFYAKYLGAGLVNSTKEQLTNLQKTSSDIYNLYNQSISGIKKLVNSKEIEELLKQGPFSNINIIDKEMSCFFMMVGSWIMENSKHNPKIFREIETQEIFITVRALNTLKA